MQRFITILTLLTACGLATAQTRQQQQLDDPQHGDKRATAAATQVPPDQTPAEAMQQSGGSLLRATVGVTPDPAQAKLSSVSFFAVAEPTPHTLKKHDLVTIVVNEESEFKSQGTTDLKKSDDLDAKVAAFVKLNLKNFAVDPLSQTSGSPEINLTGEHDFKGDATVNQSDSLVTRITAEVIDVKPNGTLVLQAREHIKHDEEDQEVILSGVCRADDVTPDNTVLSTQMFDIDLTKNHKGAVRDTNQRGWLSKVLNFLNPF